MIDEKLSSSIPISFLASLEDWEKLVRCLDNKFITEIVKHDKHLQQHEFRGFRPDHLPWERVPSSIARRAQESEAVRSSLLKSWRISNSELSKRVKEEVSGNSIEDDVARLLSSISCTEKNRNRILWALILDGREEVNQALVNGLREELVNESSLLLVKAERYRLATELEKAKQDIANLKIERDQLKSQNKEIPSLQADIQRLNGIIQQLEAKHRSEIYRQEKALQEIKSERDGVQQELVTTQQEIGRLQTELESEQLHNSEIQCSMDNLKNSLDTVITSQMETSSTFKRQLHETLQLLEEERKVSAHLRQHPEVGQKSALSFDLSQIDDYWNEAVDSIARHIALALSEQRSISQSVRTDEKWKDWRTWQQMEETFVQPLLSSLQIIAGVVGTSDLNHVESAQRLLTLRWYLLEWLKLNILEMLRADNRAIVEMKESGR